MAPLQWRDWQLLVLDFPHPGPPSPCTVLLRPLYKQVKEVKDFIVVYKEGIDISCYQQNVCTHLFHIKSNPITAGMYATSTRPLKRASECDRYLDLYEYLFG